MKVLNCTVHNVTATQMADGAIEGSKEFKERVAELLTIKEMPISDDLIARAKEYAELVKEEMVNLDSNVVLIGSGMPSHQFYIVQELINLGIEYCYSFSKRVCTETHEPNGGVKKVYNFVHEGFYQV